MPTEEENINMAWFEAPLELSTPIIDGVKFDDVIAVHFESSDVASRENEAESVHSPTISLMFWTAPARKWLVWRSANTRHCRISWADRLYWACQETSTNYGMNIPSD